jgi:hypothetical protein
MLLPPPQAGIVIKNPMTTSNSRVIEQRRRDGDPSRKMPAKLAPKPVVHQRSPLDLLAILRAGCGAVALTLIVVAPLPVIESGLKTHWLSAGRPTHANLIAPVKPGDAVMANAVIPGIPAVTVTLASDVGRQKSGAVMVKLTGEELMLGLKLWSPE